MSAGGTPTRFVSAVALVFHRSLGFRIAAQAPSQNLSVCNVLAVADTGDHALSGQDFADVAHGKCISNSRSEDSRQLVHECSA